MKQYLYPSGVHRKMRPFLSFFGRYRSWRFHWPEILLTAFQLSLMSFYILYLRHTNTHMYRDIYYIYHISYEICNMYIWISEKSSQSVQRSGGKKCAKYGSWYILGDISSLCPNTNKASLSADLLDLYTIEAGLEAWFLKTERAAILGP